MARHALAVKQSGVQNHEQDVFIEKTVKRVRLWHRKFPNDAGMPIRELISDLGLGVPNFVAREIFQDCVRLRKLKTTQDLIYDFDHSPTPDFDEDSWKRVEKIFIILGYPLAE